MYNLEKFDKVKKIISFYKKNKLIDPSLSSILYFCTWERNISYFYLKYIIEDKIKYIIFFYYYLIKNFFLLNKFYCNIENINLDHSNFLYKKIEIFWGNNISKKKNFNTYTSESYKKYIFYILIGSEKFELRNILYIKKKKINFLEIIRYIIKNKFFHFLKFIHYLNSHSIYAITFKNIILFLLKKKNFKLISIIYEGQPFQNYFIKHIKARYSCIIIGILRNFNPIPYNLIVKDKASIPDKLFVYTLDQKYHLVKFFGWDKNSVILKKNYRKKIMKNKNIIFLPFFINNSKIFTENLKIFMRSLSLEIIKSFIIKNHPIMQNSKEHISLILEIKNIIKLLLREKNINLKSKKNFYNIFLGSTSGIVESLHNEKSITIQIFCDASTEIYHHEFWPSIDRVFFNDNTIIYKKKRRFLL